MAEINGQEQGGRNYGGKIPPNNFSASLASTDQGRKQVKRPNPSYKEVRWSEIDTRRLQRELDKNRQVGNNSRAPQRGLSWEGRMRREHSRGYESSPNTSEFSDLNDLSVAKNAHHEREVERLKEILGRNPQAWKEAEVRMRAEEQE